MTSPVPAGTEREAQWLARYRALAAGLHRTRGELASWRSAAWKMNRRLIDGRELDEPNPAHPEFVRGHVVGYEQCKADHGIPDEPQPAQARVLPESPRGVAAPAEGTPAVVSSSPATPEGGSFAQEEDFSYAYGDTSEPLPGNAPNPAAPPPASPAETREGLEGAWAKMADMARHHVSALREAADSIDEANGRTPDGFDIAHASSWLRARADEIDPDPDDPESPLMRAAAALMERWPHRYDETGGHVHIDAEDPRTVAAVVLAAASPASSLPGEQPGGEECDADHCEHCPPECHVPALPGERADEEKP